MTANALEALLAPAPAGVPHLFLQSAGLRTARVENLPTPQSFGQSVPEHEGLIPLRVLIIEDRASDAMLMVHELRQAGYHPQWHRVSGRDEYLTQLVPHWDVILSDYNLPGFDALTALHDLQSKELDIPFIIVTGSISEETAVECMKEGATDYLLKDRLARLGQAVCRALHQRQLHQAKRQAEDALRASLAQKELLLKEIHHRVKNNLQVAVSMLHLQSQRITDPFAQELFNESQNRIRAMAMVHQFLYQAEDLSRIPFSAYIQDLVRVIFRSNGIGTNRVDYHIAVDEVFLNIETAMCCGLIVHELVSNALKHAFPKDQGAVWIEFRASPAGQLVLTVRDNGVGIPAGTDPRRPTSLGLRLLNTLARQLHASLEIDHEGGTSYRLTFKQLEYKDRR